MSKNQDKVFVLAFSHAEAAEWYYHYCKEHGLECNIIRDLVVVEIPEKLRGIDCSYHPNRPTCKIHILPGYKRRLHYELILDEAWNRNFLFVFYNRNHKVKYH